MHGYTMVYVHGHGWHVFKIQPRLSRKLEEEASDRRQCEQRTAGAFCWAVLGVPKTTLSKDYMGFRWDLYGFNMV